MSHPALHLDAPHAGAGAVSGAVSHGSNDGQGHGEAANRRAPESLADSMAWAGGVTTLVCAVIWNDWMFGAAIGPIPPAWPAPERLVVDVALGAIVVVALGVILLHPYVSCRPSLRQARDRGGPLPSVFTPAAQLAFTGAWLTCACSLCMFALVGADGCSVSPLVSLVGLLALALAGYIVERRPFVLVDGPSAMRRPGPRAQP